MIQQILVGIIFLGALGYVATLIVKNLQAKKACDSGCGKCGAVDVDKIQKQIAASQGRQTSR